MCNLISLKKMDQVTELRIFQTAPGTDAKRDGRVQRARHWEVNIVNQRCKNIYQKIVEHLQTYQNIFEEIVEVEISHCLCQPSYHYEKETTPIFFPCGQSLSGRSNVQDGSGLVSSISKQRRKERALQTAENLFQFVAWSQPSLVFGVWILLNPIGSYQNLNFEDINCRTQQVSQAPMGFVGDHSRSRVRSPALGDLEICWKISSRWVRDVETQGDMLPCYRNGHWNLGLESCGFWLGSCSAFGKVVEFVYRFCLAKKSQKFNSLEASEMELLQEMRRWELLPGPSARRC